MRIGRSGQWGNDEYQVPPVPSPILSGIFSSKIPRLRFVGSGATSGSVAQAKRPEILTAVADVPNIARQVQTVRRHWQDHVPPEHGNVTLHEEDVLVLMLCGFFDPLVRSLRTYEQLAQVPSVKQHLCR